MSTSKRTKEGKARTGEDFLFKRPTSDGLEDDWLHMRTRIANPDVAKAIMFYSHLYNKFKIKIFRYAVRLLEELAISGTGGGGGKGREEAVSVLIAQAIRKKEAEKRREEAEFDKQYKKEEEE